MVKALKCGAGVIPGLSTHIIRKKESNDIFSTQIKNILQNNTIILHSFAV